MIVRNFNLPSGVFAKFKLTCVCENVSMSKKVTELIESYLEKKESSGLILPKITEDEQDNIDRF